MKPSKSVFKRLNALGRFFWICQECAHQYGGKMHPDHLATFHEDKCDVCKQTKTVTQLRDYGL